MKTIDEVAKEYVYNGFLERTIWRQETINAFTAGIEFAQRWIPVEEELPEDSDNLTQTEKYAYTEHPVLTKTINGKYTVSKRSKFKGNENSKWEWIGSSSFSDSVTHWRPIELK